MGKKDVERIPDKWGPSDSVSILIGRGQRYRHGVDVIDVDDDVEDDVEDEDDDDVEDEDDDDVEDDVIVD
jgi:hypothetical protein